MHPCRILALLGALALVLTSACAPGGAERPSDAESSPDAQELERRRERERERLAEEKAEEVLAGMSTADKIGQLLVLTAEGTTAQDSADLVSRYRPGGLIYFPESLTGAEQIARMSNGLQRAAADHGAGVPLFLGIDQEQGMVSRLEIGTRFPDAMAVGATRDPDQAAALARVTAEELAALGINLDYAPDADVNSDPANPVIGIRSFGSDPDLVADLAAAEAEAFADAGVVPVVKHFPGHGDTAADSHTGLPVVDKTRREWEREDLPPFRRAVEADVDAVMTAHLVLPALDDSGEPATLSPRVVRDVLRGELGYDGMVTTDALNMEGVRQTHDDGEVAVRAVLAGVDQLLMPPDPQAAVDALRAAVEDGRISQDRLDASVRRILKVKAERGLFDAEPADVQAAAGALGTDDHRAAAAELAERSVTLLRNEGGALPAAEGATVSVTGTGAEEIGAELERLGLTVTADPAGADLAVVGTLNARGDAGQAALVASAAASGTPVAVVAQGNPYDIADLPDADAYLATYSAVDPSRAAAARVIAGEVAPSGRLPVDIPGTDLRFGDGLEY
ncbi:glycoside hydrolase family 3 protein [Streptomonospora sp. S1-112]|uniref:beta-N-acetylhexosaminidase n=1 Tax=Streptomonospora mangrovi TaxID=2883123 RepID=A0A9X3NP24_9ACTN|nr:glycoside hydrolase family 3 N-terminal domain-containing protein [Streptomonospora mangrovi]MDA0567262.1 glycoside hydrolase family 3 protein [Streptomonospora mangrovi]